MKRYCRWCKKDVEVNNPDKGLANCVECGAIIGNIRISNIHWDNNLTHQRREHETEVLQPFTPKNKPNKNFCKAYPDSAKDLFSEKEIRGAE